MTPTPVSSRFNTPELIYQTTPELLSFSNMDVPKTLIVRRRFPEVCPAQITVTLNVSAKTTADIDTTMDVRVF
ncbi:polyketide synthase [Aspergillus luchuensis]|uniref:Polyketide synthase n=1 Tax=Aspergillus kawachii TaxID=1069201 RepID=A0A146F2N5_ASPKA|nr:polyketide synthase [Aspergillus luchuensis]